MRNDRSHCLPRYGWMAMTPNEFVTRYALEEC